MSIEGQGHFFTIYFPGFVCFVLYLAKISGERLQDHWSSGFELLPFENLKFDVAILQMQYLKKYKSKDLKPVLADKE